MESRRVGGWGCGRAWESGSNEGDGGDGGDEGDEGEEPIAATMVRPNGGHSDGKRWKVWFLASGGPKLTGLRGRWHSVLTKSRTPRRRQPETPCPTFCGFSSHHA